MPYLIVSDIHGSDDGVDLIIQAKERFNAEGIISAGDQCPAGFNSAFWKSLIAVRGNCDRFYEYQDIPFPPPSRTERIYGHRITITHGDRLWLDDFDLSPGEIFVSGHTHVPMLERRNGIYVVNPGSPSRPRSSSGPTAVLFREEGLTLFSLIDFTALSSLSFSAS